VTHNNHRQGSYESLSKDFTIFMIAAKGFNDDGLGPKLQQFLKICLSHGAVNCGTSKVGNAFTVSKEHLVENCVAAKSVYTVFDDQKKLIAALKDVVKADLGISVVMSGLFDKVDECCAAVGLKRHTVEYSLGIFGKTEKLPERRIMELNTMCGHAQVSFNLIKRVAKDIQRGVLSLEEGAGILAKPCVCGIFNPKRAELILADYIASQVKPIARNLIAIDASKCDKCYACEESCLEAHPKLSQPLCHVDASQGPGVSLHCFHCGSAACMAACPTSEIYRDQQTDAVLMKGTSCIGCKACVTACPFGMIVWDDDRGVATKCDLCVDRLRDSKQPACVAGCPTASLTMVETPDMMHKKRNLALRATLASWDTSSIVPLFNFETGQAVSGEDIEAKVRNAVETAKAQSKSDMRV